MFPCPSPLLIATGEAIPLRGLEGVPGPTQGSNPGHLHCRRMCDPIDGSPLGSPAPGILQARTLEWVAISFSNQVYGNTKNLK